ncbi:EamA/RhaT family transporter [Cryobacterium sp. TMT1-21]|uniref:EamA/RhaT family transporter n=1 Tax=Cryobacterium shii TaxID=1259235 RepID=A0AAQ2C657_9MICO|nr:MULTISPECIES: EamA family transporter [Cryobacterium]TFC46637.1 EamA/RhaT family transporter [Cryobacterium shii]TFC89118.1 EamA/RhaT family transporter [Cryobacterium sp. TmT2-59]TFD17655.1 EamA/RhaT family transporter [Cryobacterium sp. TMT1-21]TFD22668.1 EamA/RhaT family transporter [Cryobacterium sp. TMT2-23]TFD36237.1 EamA/RhaT family transporter [Cryobacterium sp. TMT2-10]
MLTAVLGLTGALIFGSADFLGGLAAKRISSVLATAVAATSGLVALLLFLPFVGGAWSAEAVLWGAASGVSGAIAISLLYACLAIGPMSILSPLTAVVSAVVPATVGLAGGDRLAPIGYWALGLALLAVVLVGFVPERGAVRPSLIGVLMALGSGAMIGAFMIMIDLTPEDSGLVPLVLNRAVNGSIMFAVVGLLALVALRRRRALTVAGTLPATTGEAGADAIANASADTQTNADATSHRRSTLFIGLRLAAACGVVDVVANFLLLLGIRAGDLSVMSVLTAMYPAGTILLAAVVLRERIAPVQWLGLALALAAAGMLALA